MVNVTFSEKKVLEEYTIMTGEQETKIWIDRSIIAGIVHDSYPNLDSVSQVLHDLKLEWDTSPVLRTSPEMTPSTSHFTFIKRTDGKPISQENSPEFEKLREQFGDNFGPGIFNENGIILGVLSNSITVYFERGTSQDRINEILTLSKATKFIEVRENQYHAEFPKSLGYEVIAIAKYIFNFKEVSSVENKINVIIRHT